MVYKIFRVFEHIIHTDDKESLFIEVLKSSHRHKLSIDFAFNRAQLAAAKLLVVQGKQYNEKLCFSVFIYF